MTGSKIEWTDRSDWNPVRGCSRVSPGCGGPGKEGGCYAEGMAARFSKPGMWGHGFAEMQGGKPRWTGKVELQEDRLLMPLSWRKPAKVFPNSTSDFFHEALPDSAIDKLFAAMSFCPHLTFQIPTKRAQRMHAYFTTPGRLNQINGAKWSLLGTPRGSKIKHGGQWAIPALPLPNVWLGVSAERQQEADERIPHLLQTPAAIRFVSAEPLLSPISFRWAKWDNWCHPDNRGRANVDHLDGLRMLNWIIVGGESGPRARPMNIAWAREIEAQCRQANVACFIKQLGSKPFYQACDENCTSQDSYRSVQLIPKDRKGGDWSEWPDDLRVRQFPRAA